MYMSLPSSAGVKGMGIVASLLDAVVLSSSCFHNSDLPAADWESVRTPEQAVMTLLLEACRC